MRPEEINGGEFNIEEDEASCLFLSEFKLHRANCPFQVTSLVSNNDLEAGRKYTVDQVVGWDERTVLYRVFTKLYPHFYFQFQPPTHIVISGLK